VVFGNLFKVFETAADALSMTKLPTRGGSLARRRLAGVSLAIATALTVGLGAPTATIPEDLAKTDVVVWGMSSDLARQAVEDAGGEAGSALELVGGVAARLDARQIASVESAGFSVVDDAAMGVTAEDMAAVPVADHQFAAMNPGGDWDLDAGSGVGVAIVDTGVTEVADLRGRVVQGPDLSGEGDGVDRFGHGTFMAGLIAGDGELSASGDSRHVGVAPGAHIVSVKVAGADGSTSLSRVLDGIGWVVANADENAVRVLNLSVAVPPIGGNYHADPLSAAVEAAWASGITVVAAAGNDADHVASPGRDPFVITVGALDTGATLGAADDSVPAWSGREDLRWGAKPELLAPGVSVVSLAAPNSTVVAENPGSVVDDHYLLGTGTSMATALTAGAVAVLTEHHAAATPDDFKAALVESGRSVPGEIGKAVDLAAADLVDVGSPTDWWQRHPIAFNGLGIGLDEMPWVGSRWAGDAWVGSRWAGSRWAGSRWADEEWTGSRWADEEFAGSRWAGSRWAGSRWAGSRWAGSRWADEEFTGSRWAGSRWAGSRWAGSRWAGSRWADELWAGSRWAGSRWASVRFEGSRWAGSRWAGSSWAGSRWAGSRWAGSSWAGSRWAGSSWAGSRWAGSSWAGSSWAAAAVG
jgi:serine protease AprX